MEEKIYIHYGNTKFDESLFRQIKNKFFIKPDGGLWASPLNARYGWKDWNEDSGFRLCDENNCFKFKLKDTAKVLEINSCVDLWVLPQNPIIPEYWKRNSINDKYYIDFEQLIKDGYDAILVNLSNDSDLYWTLYGWDCDSLLVFNKEVIEEV